MAPWLVADGPGVTRAQGERLARDELAKAIYHPSVPFTVRIYDAVQRLLARFYAIISNATPGGWWGFVALAVLVVLVVGLVLYSIGPVARPHRRTPMPLWEGRLLTAHERREEAQRLAGSGEFAAAILERVRAIAADLEERAVLMPNPGLTANELASEAGQALPGQADGLRRAAHLFDEICYGQRPGTAAEYEWLCDLDTSVQNTRPAAPAPMVRAVAGAGP